ncbi:OmpA family protein [Paracoccus ravus]|uniref:OmpA family protein n=1 Tax=Paracoccus ravus TaxID=2447760 RepID=UPI001FD6CCBD|nr:OmpA family protein [Paracoccus ravus]
MANPRKRRGLAVVASLLALSAAGGLAFLGAEAAADLVEHRSEADVSQAMHDAGHDWVTVQAEGLRVHLEGTAPDEVQRFRAKSLAETVVDRDRVIDRMQVQAREALGVPEFSIELLRNEQGISIVGLVPASLGRAEMVAALRRDLTEGEVSDLVETADYPSPEGWDEAFAFGIKATEMVDRAKVSIEPGLVTLRAITESAAQKAELEAALERARPATVKLAAEISAPRPVITPFTLRFVKDEKGARFDACSAETEASRDQILREGAVAGVSGPGLCRLGLGSPSVEWVDAATASIRAVAELGAGSVTISDTEIALFAPSSVAGSVFDAAVGHLEGELPEAFVLTADHEKQPETPSGPVEFLAIQDAAGVHLRGRIGGEQMRAVVETMAEARLGPVDNALRVDETLPPGWTTRAIAALEALEGLESGNVTVTPDMIRLTGISGNQAASDMAATQLSRRLGAGAHYELSIQYDRSLDPQLALPSGVECVDRLNAVMHESEIGFEPSKSVIAGDPEPALNRISEIMGECHEYRIELGGHTDSQGSDELNAELSRTRAQAVWAAIRAHGVNVTNMTAHGYGETRPVAENDTEEGREANRRIEFTLLSEAPVISERPAPAEKVTGMTQAVTAATAEAAEKPADGAQAGPAAPETIALIAALTRPALAVVLPEKLEALDRGAIPPEDLPELILLGPPDVEAAIAEKPAE